MKRCVAVLDTMWGDEVGRAPRYFRINPHNFSGRRLYYFLDKQYHLLVTNACSELVTSAKQKGVPDSTWLKKNLQVIKERWPFDLLLVCGRTAQATYSLVDSLGSRVIEMPHPAARTWTKDSLAVAKRLIHESRSDLHIEFRGKRLAVTELIPF